VQGAEVKPRGPLETGEEVTALFDESFNPELEQIGPEESEDGPLASDLLSAEERAFVERALGFLCGRPNADLILDGIWAQVNAARPDGFYDPREVDASAEGDSLVQESGMPDRGGAMEGIEPGIGIDGERLGPRAAPKRTGEGSCPPPTKAGATSPEAPQDVDPDPLRE
jgi:hypothetical protein